MGTRALITRQLITALDPSLSGIAQPINDQIQGNFTTAVDKFKGRSGAIKIPTNLVPTATNLLAQIGPVLGKLPFGGGGGKGKASNKQRQETEMTMYCCGITQDQLDALSPEQNDLTNVPQPVVAMLQNLGVVPM